MIQDDLGYRIQDSGERRKFDTGAVRDISEGKGRCDLMPLELIGRHLEDDILVNIGRYIYSGDERHLWTAMYSFSQAAAYAAGEVWSGCYGVILDVSHHYEEGAKKYKERNWEQGIPLHSFIDSAVRHYLEYKSGYVDERHDRAFYWNLLGALWTQENKPEMIDLPFGEKEEDK